MHSSTRRHPDVDPSPSPSTPQGPPRSQRSQTGILKTSTSRNNVANSRQAQSILKVAPSPSHHADDSFLDSSTPVDEAPTQENILPEARPRPRDSHDLSLPNRNVTRDSLMTNMLLSLDQLSSMHGPVAPLIYEDRTPALSSYLNGTSVAPDDRTWSTTSRRMRSNTYGTMNSDVDGEDSSRASRGRRSNSSSNFQTGLSRINSLRDSIRSPATSHRLHTRGDRSSKNSSSNSIDAGYAQVLGSQRWAQGFGGRSSSFDMGPRHTEVAYQPWQVEFSNSFLNDAYDDAAPTPTVPPGPRRTAPSTPVTSAFPPLPIGSQIDLRHQQLQQQIQQQQQQQQQQQPERKQSMRSIRSFAAGRRDFKPAHNTGAMARDVAPQLPLFDLDSAPAPHIGYEKAKEPLHLGPVAATTTPQHPSQPQVKEKPGFFRRVFGGVSSRSAASGGAVSPPAAGLESPNQASLFSPGLSETPDHKSKQPPTPPSRDTPTSSSHPPHVLQKKPSSFFRRRKKSTSGNDEAPPPLPTNIAIDTPPVPPLVPPISLLPPTARDRLSNQAEPSPVTSLRKAMSPYLKGSPTTPIAPNHSSILVAPSSHAAEDRHPTRHQDPSVEADGRRSEESGSPRKRDFSPDHDPSVSLRPVRSVGRLDDASGSDQEFSGRRRNDTPTRPPPDVPMPSGSGERNNSFLDLDPPSDHDVYVESPVPKSRRAHREDGDDLSDSGAGDRKGDTIRAKKYARPMIGLQPDSEEDIHSAHLALPIEGARSGSVCSSATSTDYKSINSGLSSAQAAESRDPGSSVSHHHDVPKAQEIDEPEIILGEPTDDDRQKALKIFEGSEDFIKKEKAAAWMGEEGTIRQRTLKAYMELYDFTSTSIVASLRQVCERLILRAETQQVDRILLAFSIRWSHCNPSHGFKSTDVVHTICYSIMLLNTDLHIADIEQKMTRGQFVKNTMTTIRHALEEAIPGAYERPSILPGKGSLLTTDDPSIRPSADRERSSVRNSFLAIPRGDASSDVVTPDDCGPLVKSPFDGTIKAWEGQVESVLKETYASIRDERLPLFGSEPDRYQSGPASQSNLSVMGMLKRTPSVLSKTPSESQSSLRGRVTEASRTTASRWTSKSRSRPRFPGGANGFSSSRTSFEDGNSVWSPAPSSATWSRYSLGRTQTSMSAESLSSRFPRGDYQQSIGFANALSQAIIREDIPGNASVISDDLKPIQLLEDESLELAGPPWVKEGMVVHKHHLDGVDRKAKDRNWTEVFAVIQKGHMSLFSFTPNKSLRNRSRAARHNKVPLMVGGGNWQENATNLGTFSLMQTLASALPPPGYSRARPHVWALSLPTGAVHLFQVGTPEIIKEFVTTANYWSARLSTHPLVGGISNIEYGWSDSIVNNALVTAIHESTAPPPSSGSRSSRPGSSTAMGAGMPRRSSVQSGSYRSSLDQGSGRPGSSSRTKLPGDRTIISEWTPPAQSMRPCALCEGEQLQNLESYVKGIEDELQAHNQLRSPMLLAFSPRSHNAARAMANWERKSAYLLREIVKFRTYVDCLQQAALRKDEIYHDREAILRAAGGGSVDDSDHDERTAGETDGDTTLRA